MFIYFFMGVAHNFILCYFSRSALTVWQYDSCHKVCKCRIFMVAGLNCPLTFFQNYFFVAISLFIRCCFASLAQRKEKKSLTASHTITAPTENKAEKNINK